MSAVLSRCLVRNERKSDNLIKLIRNADVYAPAHLGKKDVLVIADKVVRIADKIEGYEGMPE